jgi:hypothetical protein
MNKIGKLEVIQRLPNSIFLCKCDCGNERRVKVGHFNTGKIKSCGCHVERHGMYGTREYSCWSNMLSRCENPKNKRYKDYGGKGISVCKSWHKFNNFYADMGKCPPGYQIDRINNSGDYEPKNCHWVTPKQNMANRDLSVIYEIDGNQYLSSVEAAYKLNVSVNTIRAWCIGRRVKDKFYPPKIGCKIINKRLITT